MSEKKGIVPLAGADVVFAGLKTKAQVALNTTTPVEIVPANGSRGRLIFMNTSASTSIVVSQSSTLTAGDGMVIPASQYCDWKFLGELWGLSSAGTVNVSVCELQ